MTCDFHYMYTDCSITSFQFTISIYPEKIVSRIYIISLCWCQKNFSTSFEHVSIRYPIPDAEPCSLYTIYNMCMSSWHYYGDLLLEATSIKTCDIDMVSSPWYMAETVMEKMYNTDPAKHQSTKKCL